MGTIFLQTTTHEQAQRILSKLPSPHIQLWTPERALSAGINDLVLYFPESQPADTQAVVEHIQSISQNTNLILILPQGHSGWIRMLPPDVVADALPEDTITPDLLQDVLHLHTTRLETGQLGRARLDAEHLMRLQRDLVIRLGQTTTLHQALDTVLKAALLLPGIDSGVLCRVDPDYAMQPAAYRGVSESFVQQFFHRKRNPQWQLVLSQHKPLYQNSQDTQTHLVLAQEGIKAQAILPIASSDTPFAALYLFSHVFSEIPENLYLTLETISGQLAAMLQHIHLVEEQQTTSRLLYALIHTSPDGILVANEEGRVVLTNPIFEHITGLSTQDSRYRYLWEIMAQLIPQARLTEEMQRRMRSEVLRMTREKTVVGHAEPHKLTIERPDGTPATIELHLFTVDTPAGTHFATLVRDITEREQQHRALEHHLDELQAITEVNTAILQTLELQPLLENVLAAACRVIPGAEKGSVVLRNSQSDALELVALHNYRDPRVMQAGDTIKKGYAVRAIREASPLMIEDVQSDPSLVYDGDIPEMVIRSAITAPLRVDEEVLGAISLDNSSRTSAFTEHDLHLLTAFAGQAALAIRHARLYERVRDQLERLSLVQHISSTLRLARDVEQMLPILLDETLSALQTDTGAILLYNNVHQVLEIAVARGWFKQFFGAQMNPDEGISGSVFTSKQARRLDDIHTAPDISRAFKAQVPENWAGACIPIQNENRSLGVLWVAVPAPRRITPEHMSLLITIADLAGNALQRMRLHAETRKQLQRLTLLRTIDATINASMDLRLTFHVMLEQLCAQPNVGAAAVALFDPNTQALDYLAWYGLSGYQRKDIPLWLSSSPAYPAILERKTVTMEGTYPLPVQFSANGRATPSYPMYTAVPLIAKGQIKGVLEVFYTRVMALEPEWETFLQTLGTQAAIAVDNATLLENLQSANQELRTAYERTLQGWARALELRDMETQEHTRRVTEMTVRLASALGVTGEQLEHIRRGALLHDIGKLGVPDSILHKPGPLTDEEWAEMHKHPVYAYRWLRDIDYLRPAIDIPYCHHEKWDGSGYPQGLRGEEIPLAARIFAVVDVWDALSSNRPYRQAWPPEKVQAYIIEQRGIHFDPHVVDVFLELLAEYEPLDFPSYPAGL